MRYLILSDLHANWEALDAVIRETQGKYDKAICCGDLVGYAADPNRVVDWVRENCDVVVRGNHDRACTGLDDLQWFNPIARQAALWTLEQLSKTNVDYTALLAKGPVMMDGFEIVHGSPYDEDEYVIAAGEAGTGFRLPGEPARLFRPHSRAGRLHLESLSRGDHRARSRCVTAVRRWISIPIAPT